MMSMLLIFAFTWASVAVLIRIPDIRDAFRERLDKRATYRALARIGVDGGDHAIIAPGPYRALARVATRQGDAASILRHLGGGEVAEARAAIDRAARELALLVCSNSWYYLPAHTKIAIQYAHHRHILRLIRELDLLSGVDT